MVLENKDRDMLHRDFLEFCRYYYAENCHERRQFNDDIHLTMFRYIRANYKWLKRKWKRERGNI